MVSQAMSTSSCLNLWIYYLLSGSVGKNPPAKQEMRVQSLGWENPLEKEMATHSSILTWEIPRSLVGFSPWDHKGVGHDLATKKKKKKEKNGKRYSAGGIKNPPKKKRVSCIIWVAQSNQKGPYKKE